MHPTRAENEERRKTVPGSPLTTVTTQRDEETTPNELIPRASNWTTQAWQTHCNNIDWFGDFNECCLHVSGPNWRSCKGLGWATISESGILCYSIEEEHDCCADGSVCDKGVGCCSGKCCQTDSSETVCTDGCVSPKGRGCADGTCKIPDNGSPTTGGSGPSQTDGGSPTETGGPASTGSSGTSVQRQDGGLSTGEKAGLAVSLIVGVPALILAFMQWVFPRHTIW